jgi:hypothetical protein
MVHNCEEVAANAAPDRLHQTLRRIGGDGRINGVAPRFEHVQRNLARRPRTVSPRLSVLIATARTCEASATLLAAAPWRAYTGDRDANGRPA